MTDDTELDDLVRKLTDPDPAVRDGYAYSRLWKLITDGELDGRIEPLGDAAAAHFDHPEVQARTFAPLVVALAVERGLAGPAATLRWKDAFLAWWPAEQDIRGWDERLGWLHAIAHGADLAGTLGASPDVDPVEILTAIGERVVAPTTYQYAHQEDDRVAQAIRTCLERPELSEADATAWLAPVDRLFATGKPGPVPTPVANTFAVLKATYVMVNGRDLALGKSVTDAIRDRLHTAYSAY
ncbi:DUF2785 domain-containing protein [Hamadaea tsunoensis]|uniref:DUF2785 domain-containing protein n=1 Tax=Hamadaea tsunoensis TaxID=53368 RepID=UPI0003FE3EFB|nr:DUF2785 domain-containing protein [Hamadaea tsunoensis]